MLRKIQARLARPLSRAYSDRPETWQMDKLTDIGSRKIFTEEHDIMREQVRKFYESVPMERKMKWEEQGHLDREFFKECGKQGLIGIEQSADKHGHGLDFYSNVIQIEEQIYGLVPGLMQVQNDLVLPYICSYGTDEQVDRYVPGIRDGEIISCLCMTEPGSGSDVQGIKTNAIRDGDDWILNGSKVFISCGYMSDMAIVVAVTDKDAEKAAYGISLFLVDTNLPGFEKGKLLKKIGRASADTAELFFNDVRLPANAVLGGEEGINRGFQFLMHDLGRERLLVAMGCTAQLEKAFELTREYVHEREAFGKPLIANQQVRHTLAEVKTECMVLRTITDKHIQAYAEGDLDQQSVSMLKYYTSEKCIENITKLQQLWGGYGYMLEYPIAQMFSGVRVESIYAGTTEIMKELVARTL
ncbi:Oidioi.mRNA.OKI2018_I69.chr2.g5664.t1.cds [Oikopleura dioica]|uniref:Oidioi.mRNA.OKI2018_I69.chr2.g5664.t1.cds n=1 Tax=Oikopleura dioica TaxID=34765 RepID=A0ABN7T7L3_OIKDI|nr:Oidioi.mRNA.OKI2018_I69.chr2.g5664.t1.cds [Oikopleura dioica]